MPRKEFVIGVEEQELVHFDFIVSSKSLASSREAALRAGELASAAVRCAQLRGICAARAHAEKPWWRHGPPACAAAAGDVGFGPRCRDARDGGAHGRRRGFRGPTFPAVRRQGARLSREQSKEAVTLQGGMLGAGSAGVPRWARCWTRAPGRRCHTGMCVGEFTSCCSVRRGAGHGWRSSTTCPAG